MTEARRDESKRDEPQGDPETSTDTHLSQAYHRSVVDGEERLHRTLPNLCATGFVGGMDVGVGVFGLLVVQSATGSRLLGALAFTGGFIILVLARSELFTENFLVPVTTVVSKRRDGWPLMRLWLGTLVTNWVGGAMFMVLVMAAVPEVHPVAVEIGSFYPELGIGWHAFASAVLGGVLITLMTWIERGTREVIAKLVIAVAIGFLLAAAPLNHSVVGALEMVSGLITGDSGYSWLDALGAACFSIVGNLVGGVGLVTVLRLVQVGERAIEAERANSD